MIKHESVISHDALVVLGVVVNLCALYQFAHTKTSAERLARPLVSLSKLHTMQQWMQNNVYVYLSILQFSNETKQSSFAMT